jgi:hypothetical protein
MVAATEEEGLSLSARARHLLWDLVAVAAVVGVVYGTFESISDYGFWKGLALAVVATIAGYLAMHMLYPLWFTERREDNGKRK